MSKVFYIGLICLLSKANGFNSNNFLENHCEIDSSTLTCSFIKFSTKENDEIQNTNFTLSNASDVRFEQCDILVNGAFFEKFPKASQFEFVGCNINFVNNSKRQISSHNEMRNLIIEDSNIKNWPLMESDSLKTLFNLETISFHSIIFSEEIGVGLFQQIPNIKNIIFDDCDVFIDGCNAFRGLKKLQSLRISRSTYLTLDVGFFEELNNLQNLYLVSNGIDQLPAKLLPSNLKILDLSDNSLRFITKNMFSRLTLLNTLDLSGNSIEHLSDMAFDNLGRLEHLYLQDNNMTYFSERLFNGTKNLLSLDISKNQMTYIYDAFFDNLESLERFYY